MKYLILCCFIFTFSLQAQEALLDRGAVTLAPFTTDGCSWSPDGIPGKLKTAFYNCCVRHDVWYWIGGTEQDRLSADQELAMCVYQKSNFTIARLYYWGVRTGGGPYHNTKFRWGYGWSELQNYTTLTEAERELRNQQFTAAKNENYLP